MTIWLSVNVILVIAYAHAQLRESTIQEGAADKVLIALGEVPTKKKKKATKLTDRSHRIASSG